MLNYLQLGGPVMFILLGLSVIALTIFIERVVYLTKTSKRMKNLTSIIETEGKVVNITEIKEKLKNQKNNILATLMEKIVEYPEYDEEEMRNLVTEEANKEIPKLERYISVMGVIYTIAPMLGLLGTIIGLIISIQGFADTTASGSFDIATLLDGIYTALLTTVAGLIIAIPTHIGHTYLIKKVNAIVLNLEVNAFGFIRKIKR